MIGNGIETDGWQQGLDGIERTLNAGDNSGVLCLIAGTTILMMLSYRYCRHLFTIMSQELLGVHRRDNAFDEHTSHERQVLLLMALQWSVYTALLLYCFLSAEYRLPPADAFVDLAKLTALTGGYYLLQRVVYWLVGYTFVSPEGRRSFVQGFTASQSLLGFALVIPALVALFYPGGTGAMLLTGCALYILARAVFIIKGFRIFYENFSSLLYFILYLCTLEIIPIICIYKIALLLVGGDS